jgi:hypothetical protein
MNDRTERLGLPMLYAGQAQKELTHNEALTLIDLLLAGVVEAVGRDEPPGDPQPGQCWIVGAEPQGEWAGHAGWLAGWTPGGWRFVAPREGMRLTLAGSGIELCHRDGIWHVGEVRGDALWIAGERVVGSRQPAIAVPSGGAIVDAEARSAIAHIVTTLQQHGLTA